MSRKRIKGGWVEQKMPVIGCGLMAFFMLVISYIALEMASAPQTGPML